ncbi:MAG: D-glycero-beta-D-manno-heptose 1-phosphate adenylyltransferase [Aquificaceae bacterium]|nr:D-glycero-beta-D-manno-heptose 1-phosphate adenylyltransferase [Aquificaceae bacterium]MCX7989038.1 D-glycero-beta-D-manno-heptose 1-phosphate adenylyltransferase [Aquificaceae bacterium]MDW8032181.1 D-glycero-beta-D-manno-heptose 1-phosphate adenylyltransferase [Aquificaceae bacterium]MDW8294154.1 D-glycero-beta-D-manno-heptose 1-phosphate adenylyltransferase [Aquificaceae bacterium]
MVLSQGELLKVLEPLRENSKIVFTNGCFDLLHAGHAHYLKKAKELGDLLVVGLNSDESVRRIKGRRRPILPQSLRAYLLDSLKPVDYVVIFEEDTPEKLIKAVRPHVLVKGADWEVEKIVGADFVLSYGGEVRRVEFEFDLSTSKIIDRILELYRDAER